MTIGIEEAQRRNRMSSYCTERNYHHHAKCHGYRRVKVDETAWPSEDVFGTPTELEFCECECHSTHKGAIAPSTPPGTRLRMNPGVSGEGDS